MMPHVISLPDTPQRPSCKNEANAIDDTLFNLDSWRKQSRKGSTSALEKALYDSLKSSVEQLHQKAGNTALDAFDTSVCRLVMFIVMVSWAKFGINLCTPETTHGLAN